jgi:ABC-type branched-subunit amino acid transport system ATPase component
VSGSSFPLDTSLTVVAIVAIGGIGSIVGPVLGSLYLIALPRFLPLDNAGIAATQLAWLILILQFPGGVVQAYAPARAALLKSLSRGRYTSRRAARQQGDEAERDLAGAAASVEISSAARVRPQPPGRATALPGGAILAVDLLNKRYGGLHAVRDVSLQLFEGETLGLIGPNGAGKTTLFEIIGGFVPADTGRVIFDGTDVTDVPSEQRARLGLIRSFQDARLFPTMTLSETIEVALERVQPATTFGELSGLRTAKQRRSDRASEVIEVMGLHAYRDIRCAELSTGTRRLAEIACLLALEPSVLLLDEPSSGITQHESEALGRLLWDVKQFLGTTLFVIEHNIPLIMSISDRMIAMALGSVIATGTPAQVRDDPGVLSSYLGTAEDAAESLKLGRKPTAPDADVPDLLR